jgi:predicted permease
MDQVRQDVIVSIRRLRSSPGFTLAAILTLALGIGANTAIFTAVNALIFRPLPVGRPNELVFLNTRGYNAEYPVQSYPNYIDLRDRNKVLSGLAGYRFAPVSFSRGDSNNARIWAYEVTGNYFDVLGVGAARGRVLHPEDDRVLRGHPVVVISYAFWQLHFGGDAGVVGSKIKLNGMDYSVIGVAPRGFSGTEVVFTPDIWVPIAMEPQIEPGYAWLDERGSQNLFVVGRLKPGVTLPQAEGALNAIAAELGREHPKENAGIKIVLSPPGLFGTYIRGTVRAFAVVLMGVAGMVLLIACVNLASLLLARAADRRKETAIRLALGAPRGRLVRQLLTESMLLSILGGAAGLLLSIWIAALFAAWRPPVSVPIIPALGVDFRVMIFAAFASLVTGVLFGLAPALQSTSAELAPALKNEAVAERLRRFPIRDILVAAQVALSVVLLFGSVLVIRSLQHVLSLNLGFEPRHAAALSFDVGLQGYDETRARDFQRRILERVRGLPGIESAGTISGLPLSLNWNNSGVFIEGKPIPRASETTLAAMFSISPGYLRAARTKLTAGRDLEESDNQSARHVVLVNQAFARKLLPGENPIGKRFRHNTDKTEWWEIAGVVEDGKYRSLGEQPMPAVFEPVAQSWNSSITVVARSSMPEDQVVGSLRRAVAELDPSMSTYDGGSLTNQLGLVLFPARIAATILSAFGLLAVVLAATGVYGVMAYAVSRRTREIGIRMALGARPSQVLGSVLSHTALLFGVGTGAGIALALVAGQLFSSILYGVSPKDPATYALVIALMAVVAFIACWFPARRAISLNPVTALRTE